MKTLAVIELQCQRDTNFAPLLKSLQGIPGMTAPNLAKFRALLMEEQTAVMAAAAYEGDSSEADGQRIAAAAAASEDEIKQTLGDLGYAQYSQYEVMLPQRKAVELVTHNLDYSAPPLTDNQCEVLMAILAQNPTVDGALNSQSGLTQFPNLLNPEPAGVSKEALDAAVAILSPQQMEALEAVRLQQQTHLQMLSWVNEAQQGMAQQKH